MYKRVFILATVAVFAMVSCAKELQQTVPDSFGSTDVHSLSVGIEAGEYMPTDATKASMNAIVRVDWKQGDKVSVVNASTGYILGGCLKADSDGAVTTFSGDVSGTLNKNDKLYYIFPALDVQVETSFSEQEISLKAQTYDATKSNEVCFHGYAEDTYSGDNSAGTNISKSIKFNPVTAYVHLNMSNIPAKNADLTSIDLSNVNGGFKWVLENATVSAKSYLENQGISVTCSNTKISQSGNAVVRFAVPASPAAEEARVLTVNKAYSLSNYSNAERKAAGYYNQLYSTWVSSNVEVDDKGTEVNVKVDNGGSTESAEAALPVVDAFKSGKTEGTKIEMGGVGTVIFNQTASEKILDNAEKAGSTSVFFKVEDVTNDTDVQNKNIVYEVTMKTVDEKGVEVFSEEKTQGSDGVATIIVPLGDDVLSVKSVSLLDENGQPITGGVQSYEFDQTTRVLTIKVVHFSKYAISYTKRTQPITAVAQIGERNYESLSSAIAAVQNGNTIKLLCDCNEGEGIVVPGGKNFTLDFGGHTYKVTKDLAGSTGTKNQCFQLLKGSTLVFQNGTITTSCAKIGINTYSTLTLNNINIDMTGSESAFVCLMMTEGDIKVQGNTNLIAKDGKYAAISNYWPASYGDIDVVFNTTGEIKGIIGYGSNDVQDKTIVKDHSHFKIIGGKYNVSYDMEGIENPDFKIYGGVFKTSPDTKYLAPNHEVVTNTDSETSASYPHKVQQKPYVAMIGENGYFSLADALVAVKNNETIVMHQNDVLTKGLTITLENNEAFTLDLNGKTVSIAETGFDFTANNTKDANKIRNGIPARFAIVVNGVGSMTICDNSTGESGRLETKNNSYGTTKTILVDGNAIVNVNSGTIAADYAAFYVVGHTEKTAAPANAPKPTLNVNGGKILGQMVGIGIKGNTATLKVTGGEIIANEYTGVSTNGTQDWYDGGKFAIEITGGLIKSGEGAAMYLPAEGPTVITGGTIEGADGIVVKGGSLSISGNTIVKATGSFGQAASASSGYTDTGSAIYVEDTYENHAPIVNISGGKFSSVNNKAVEYFTTKAADAADKGKVTLTGGVYSNAPDASLVAEGYAVVDNTDSATKTEYPKTVKFHPVVKIGNVEYANIAAAFAAVPTDGTPTTVTLLENIGSKNGEEIVWKEYDRTFAYTVNDKQNITFDLNGKKIYAKTTVNGYTGFLLVKNGGSLTIKDSAGGGELNYLDGKDNEGGLAISSEGNLTMLSGTVENHTHCVNAAIQGAIDVHANEWGTPYAHHVTFNMEGGVLKSQTDNTLRIYDSSQTGTGGVVIDFEINGGEIYGADAVFIMPAWIAGPTHVSNDTHMNNINVSVTGGHFDTTNGIRVFGAVNAPNDKDYKAIDISVTGGEFIVRGSTKYREGHIAYQNNYVSSAEAVPNLVSFTKVTWTADAPTYID